MWLISHNIQYNGGLLKINLCIYKVTVFGTHSYISFQVDVKPGCMIKAHSNHLNDWTFCLNRVSIAYTVLSLVFDKNVYNTTVSKAVTAKLNSVCWWRPILAKGAPININTTSLKLKQFCVCTHECTKQLAAYLQYAFTIKNMNTANFGARNRLNTVLRRVHFPSVSENGTYFTYTQGR